MVSVLLLILNWVEVFRFLIVLVNWIEFILFVFFLSRVVIRLIVLCFFGVLRLVLFLNIRDSVVKGIE